MTDASTATHGTPPEDVETHDADDHHRIGASSHHRVETACATGVATDAFSGLPVEPLARGYEPVRPGDILAFAAMRNEAIRLPAFLDHHRKLGVARFFIVDNGSSDDTKAILTAAGDVVPFYTTASFQKANCARLDRRATRQVRMWPLVPDARCRRTAVLPGDGATDAARPDAVLRPPPL